MSYLPKFVSVLMYKHQKALYPTWVENEFIEEYQMTHRINRKSENPSQKRGQGLRKPAKCNHVQGWKMKAIWVQVGKWHHWLWILNPRCIFLSSFATLRCFHHFLNILVSGQERWLHAWVPETSKGKRASSSLLIGGKMQIPVRIHTVRGFPPI